MKRLRKFFRWIAERFKDLWFGPDNEYLDLGRVLSTIAVLSIVGGQLWNIRLGKELDLGPAGLGGGVAAAMTASAAFLAAKAWSKKKARESAAIAQNTAVAKEAGENVVEVAPPQVKP